MPKPTSVVVYNSKLSLFDESTRNSAAFAFRSADHTSFASSTVEPCSWLLSSVPHAAAQWRRGLSVYTTSDSEDLVLSDAGGLFRCS